MKAKILVSVVILIVAMAMVAGGTFAYMSDVGTSKNNTIAGGTLDLTINDNNSETVSAVFAGGANIVPGTYANTGVVTIKNIGSLPGQLTVRVNNVVNSEVSLTGPEISLGDTMATGELGPKLSINLQENQSPWAHYAAVVGLTDGLDQTVKGRVLQPGESIQLVNYVSWVSTANDNIAQGDTVTYDVTFYLDQIK